MVALQSVTIVPITPRDLKDNGERHCLLTVEVQIITSTYDNVVRTILTWDTSGYIGILIEDVIVNVFHR
jgi:hypothetical protein